MCALPRSRPDPARERLVTGFLAALQFLTRVPIRLRREPSLDRRGAVVPRGRRRRRCSGRAGSAAGLLAPRPGRRCRGRRRRCSASSSPARSTRTASPTWPTRSPAAGRTSDAPADPEGLAPRHLRRRRAVRIDRAAHRRGRVPRRAGSGRPVRIDRRGAHAGARASRSPRWPQCRSRRRRVSAPTTRDRLRRHGQPPA